MTASSRILGRTSWRQVLDLVLPWPFLSIVILFTYARFVIVPYLGFDYSGNIVTDVFVMSAQKGIEVGDRLISVAGTELLPFNRTRVTPLLRGIEHGDEIPIYLERDGNIIRVDWLVPGPDLEQVYDRTFGPWWISYVFWLAGTATLLYIRPRDARRNLLTLNNYLGALFIIIGSSPRLDIWNSSIILVISVYLSIPILLHLLWVYPKPFNPLPHQFWILAYSTSFLFAILHLSGVIPESSSVVALYLTITGGFLLLFFRWFIQKESRQDINLLILAIGLIILPILFRVIANLIHLPISSSINSLSSFTLPVLPSVFFLIAYRHQYPILERRLKLFTYAYFVLIILTVVLTITVFSFPLRYLTSNPTLSYGVGLISIVATSILTGFVPFLALPAISGEVIFLGSQTGEIEIRANRLLSQFLFFILLTTAMVILFFLLTNMFTFTGGNLLAATIALLLLGVATVIFFPPFISFIDQTILGIKIDSQEILIRFSEQITTSLEIHKLNNFLEKEVLPSLLVRQSVLMLRESGNWNSLLTLGIDHENIPSPESIRLLQDHLGEQLSTTLASSTGNNWVRLVIPLTLSGQTIGLWLFGKRDPDDFYAPSEIRLLNSLANQVAIAFTNIRQADRLRTLYQSNIDRQEEEKKEIARLLHDQVLGQIVAISLSATSPESNEIAASFSKLTTNIRSMITNLRPAMLTYGLWRAIDELVDECTESSPKGIQIHFDIPKSEVRYDRKAEEHLYRIIQQACENAMRHANPQNIRISGDFSENQVSLAVEDDGVGIPFKHLDLESLVKEHHFGLAGMYERAQLLGADFRIDTAPGKGTTILVHWIPPAA